jgi:hypothetical protein
MPLKTWLCKLNRRNFKLIPKIPLRFKVLFLFVVVSAVIIFNQKILAQTPTPQPASTQSVNIIKEKQDAIKNGSNQEAWLDEALGSNIVSGIRTLGGDVPDNVLKGEADPNYLYYHYMPGGAIGGTSKIIASLYNPPVSGIEYIAELKDNFLGRPVYAQGVGFKGLSPLQPIWKQLRNVVYILSSVVFIVIGIMIILRVKVNPQTVVSVQNAVPQIIITLIMVTFSYAIAGLLIDFIYFIQAFFIALLFKSTLPEPLDLQTELISHNFFGKLREVIFSVNGLGEYNAQFNFQYLSNPGFFQFYEMVKAIIPSWWLFALGTVLGPIIGGIIGSWGGAGLGLLSGGALFVLILQILILICLLKFFLGLIKAYVIILLKVVTAPLEIGAGAFPNSKLNFSTWIYSLIAHLAIFPISVIFIVLINIIVRNSGSGGDIWAPNLIGVMGKFNLVPAIIGLAGILLLPKLPDLVPQIIFSIKPSPWGTAIGQTFKEVSGPFKAGGNYYLERRSTEEMQNWSATGAQQASARQKASHAFWNMLGNFGVIKRK